MKKLLILLGGAAAILSAFRTVLLKSFTEAETGFYIRGSSLPLVFYIVAGVTAALFFFIFLKRKDLPSGRIDIKALSGRRAAAAFGLLALALAVDFGLSFFVLSKGTPDMFSIILFVATGAGVFAAAVLTALLVADKPLFERCYLMLVVAGWATVFSICTFREYRTISTIGENLFDIIAAVSVMLFLFFLGKCFYGESCARITAAIGSFAFLACATALLPGLFLRVIRAQNVFLLPLSAKQFIYGSMLLLVPVALSLLVNAEDSGAEPAEQEPEKTEELKEENEQEQL